VKLFFKRLRKNKHEFRYLISEERGETANRLHWHVLLHCNNSLTKRKLVAQWHIGNVHCRLARSDGLGRYMAKYAAKQSRIRASVRYGQVQHLLNVLNPRINDEVEHWLKTGEKPSWTDRYTLHISRWGFDYGPSFVPLIINHSAALDRWEASQGIGGPSDVDDCPF
jgi:hypothetical protein